MISLEDIERAIKDHEFFLEYLPTISLETGKCVGAEALIRWRKADGTILYPNSFVPLMEKTFMSGLITFWLIDAIAREVGGWLKAHPDFKLSLNIPPELSGRGGIAYVLIQSGLLAYKDQLIFEITERGMPDEIGATAISNMAHAGFNIALDDATLTSAASMIVYARCGFNVIKLDRSLILQIEKDKPLPHWLDHLTTLVAVTKAYIIAEGVDDPYHIDVLRQANIQHAQGFYFSKPISFEKLQQFKDRAHFLFE